MQHHFPISIRLPLPLPQLTNVVCSFWPKVVVVVAVVVVVVSVLVYDCLSSGHKITLLNSGLSQMLLKHHDNHMNDIVCGCRLRQVRSVLARVYLSLFSFSLSPILSLSPKSPRLWFINKINICHTQSLALV